MERTHLRQPIFFLKLIVVVLILCLTLPFYGGNTTSALNSLDFVHNSGQDINPSSGNDNKVKPPAKVNYESTDNEPVAPVQVMPIPRIQTINRPSKPACRFTLPGI